MKAVKIYGVKDLRVDEIPEPSAPGKNEVLLKIKTVGVCGSDLHNYSSGKFGGIDIVTPFVMGHEFMGEVIAVGEGAKDGNHQPLKVGQRVAVDPTIPCYHCEMCETGNPNLCPNHIFYGGYPTDGALQEKMICDSRSCFPMPDSVTDAAGPLLETLGVAIHALDLGKIKIANSVAVLGCGPVGLLILRLLKLAGAYPIYAFDCFPWRVEKALEWGATGAWVVEDTDPVEQVKAVTGGRGVDVVFEAAWADHSVQQAAEMARYGGRLVLVGIPEDDNLQMKHSIARRKGLTIMVSRRMKFTYPRAITLATAGKDVLDLDSLVSHHLPITDVPKAYEINVRYEPGVHKIIIDV